MENSHSSIARELPFSYSIVSPDFYNASAHCPDLEGTHDRITLLRTSSLSEDVLHIMEILSEIQTHYPITLPGRMVHTILQSQERYISYYPEGINFYRSIVILDSTLVFLFFFMFRSLQFYVLQVRRIRRRGQDTLRRRILRRQGNKYTSYDDDKCG